MSALSSKKSASAITEKLVCRMSTITAKTTSLSVEPSVMNRIEKSSSALVMSAVSKAGATKVSSRESSLSRRAVAMPKV